ncbi:MAG: hypothetical protein ACI36Y_09565 [Coriobacteriales bacterium]
MKKIDYFMKMLAWEKCLVLLPPAAANLFLLSLFWLLLVPRTLAIRTPNAEEWAGILSCTIVFALGFIRGANNQLDARAELRSQEPQPVSEAGARRSLRIKVWQLAIYVLVLIVASVWLPPNMVVKFFIFWSCIFLTDISNSFANRLLTLRAATERNRL